MANDQYINSPIPAQSHSEDAPEYPTAEFMSVDGLREEVSRRVRYAGEERIASVDIDGLHFLISMGDASSGVRLANWTQLMRNDPPSFETLGAAFYIAHSMQMFHTLMNSLVSSADELETPSCRLIEWRVIAIEVIKSYLPHVRGDQYKTAKDLCEYVAMATTTTLNAAREDLQRFIDHESPSGYVYLIKSSTGAYKIGKSKDPKNRMKTFGVLLPFEVEYECLLPSNNMHVLEDELHDFYATLRLQGEWFEMDDHDIAFFKSLAVIE